MMAEARVRVSDHVFVVVELGLRVWCRRCGLSMGRHKKVVHVSWDSAVGT